jgi:hypothetical protein
LLLQGFPVAFRLTPAACPVPGPRSRGGGVGVAFARSMLLQSNQLVKLKVAFELQKEQKKIPLGKS